MSKYEIVYNDVILATLSTGEKKTLKCNGKKMKSDVIIRKVEEVNLISFTIGGTTYQAEEGMTWKDWYTSEYNTTNYYISGIQAGVAGTYVVLNNGSTLVKSWDLITEGYAYKTKFLVGEGGGGSN